MKSKFTEIARIIFAVGLTLSSLTHAAAQEIVSFSGDLLIKEGNTTTKAKLYVKSPFVQRVEMSKEADGTIFIRNKESRPNIWMLDPVKKEYKILSWPDTHKDPVSAWTDMQYEMGGSFAGKDTIDGHPCLIYDFKYQGKDKIALKVWLADDVHYAIKRIADAESIVKKNGQTKPIKGTFQIVNIKVKNLDDALFVIPPDYTEIK